MPPPFYGETMDSFPRSVYRSPGIIRHASNASYKFVSVHSEAELKTRLAEGWFKTEIEAIAAAGDEAYLYGLPPRRAAKVKKILLAKKKAAPPPPATAEEKEDDSPPTRAELEEMADKLGVRFDGRTSDSLLSKRIENRLRENRS